MFLSLLHSSRLPYDVFDSALTSLQLTQQQYDELICKLLPHLSSVSKFIGVLATRYDNSYFIGQVELLAGQISSVCHK